MECGTAVIQTTPNGLPEMAEDSSHLGGVQTVQKNPEHLGLNEHAAAAATYHRCPLRCKYCIHFWEVVGGTTLSQSASFWTFFENSLQTP